MQLLLKENFIVDVASKIEVGVYDESFEKYALYDRDNNFMYYAIKEHYTISEDVILPEDYVEGKYFFEDGEFVLNEDWRPYIPPEQRIENLETDVAEQEISNAIFAEELLNTQIALTEQYETNITLEEELISTQLALTEQYETNIALEEELTSTKEELDSAQNEIVELQLAICELYENMV